MITVNGRFFAIAVMTLASGAVFAIGAYAAVTQRLTERQALAGFALLALAVAAALWLRRDRLNGRRS